MESENSVQVRDELTRTSAPTGEWIQPSIRHLNLSIADQKIIDGVYAVVVERFGALNPEQLWFWTERWQAGERQVDAYIQAGQVDEFDTIEDFLGTLKK